MGQQRPLPSPTVSTEVVALQPVRHRRAVVATVAARASVPFGVLWGSVFGIVVVSSVAGYVAAYPTVESRIALAHSLGSNAGLQALLGPARNIETVAGFTVWRTLGLVNIVGAIWGLLLGTKCLRGEEEAGRWELLLTGRTTRRRATAEAIVGQGVGILALWATTAAIVVIDGRTNTADFSIPASLYFALALTCSAAVFFGVGALASQLVGTRRQASGVAASILGVSLVLKIVADSAPSVHWAIWASPIGWIEQLRPLTGAQPIALIPIGLVTAGLCTAVVFISAHRDLGASVIRQRDEAPAHLRLLGGPTGLTVRLVRSTAAGWIVGFSAIGLFFGLIAKSAASALADSGSVGGALTRLIGRRGGAEAYLGFAFLLIATMAELVAAGQIVALREEERDARLEGLIVRSVTRRRWIAGHLGVAATVILCAAVAAGIAAWLGAAIQHTSIGFATMVTAGLNASAAGLCLLGIGTLVYGVWPRATAPAVYGLTALSYLIELVGTVVRANHFLLDLSPLYHLAAAPAEQVNWTSWAILVGVGCGTSLLGAFCFFRRDIAGA